MKRTSVDLPERIECLDTSGRLLAEAKGTRLSKFTTGASVGSWRKRLLDEVGLQTIIRDISTYRRVSSTHEDDGRTVELDVISLVLGKWAIKKWTTNREPLGQFNKRDDYKQLSEER